MTLANFTRVGALSAMLGEVFILLQQLYSAQPWCALLFGWGRSFHN